MYVATGYAVLHPQWAAAVGSLGALVVTLRLGTPVALTTTRWVRVFQAISFAVGAMVPHGVALLIDLADRQVSVFK